MWAHGSSTPDIGWSAAKRSMKNTSVSSTGRPWCARLSPKRLALLRHVHQCPARNVRTLAQALGRNYRRVHEDVGALGAAGLLERDKDGVRADYDAVDVQMRLVL